MMTGPSPRQASLQNRLVATLVTSLVSVWLVGVLVAGYAVRREVDEMFDSALQEVVQGILPLAYIEFLDRDPDQSPTQRAPYVNRQQEYISFIIRDRDGKILLQSHDADPASFPPNLKTGFQNYGMSRAYSEAAVRNTIFATALEQPGHRRHAIRDATLALTLPLAILVPAMVGAVWWAVDRAFRPVADLGKNIARRGGSDLSDIPDAGLPSELKPVGLAVNSMLARLRRTLEAERSFSANSAHELRTPIAGALSQAQRMLAETRDASARTRLLEIERSLHRLARTTEKLLQLAKAEGAALRAGEPQDLAPILMLVLKDFEPQEGSHIEISSETTMSRLDIDAFAIVVRNLVENALRHGTQGETVHVSLAGGVLSVGNAGPVISPEEFETLKARLERSHRGSVGTGLGLSIISTIAAGGGGRLEMISPRPGSADGVEFRFILPEQC